MRISRNLRTKQVPHRRLLLLTLISILIPLPVFAQWSQSLDTMSVGAIYYYPSLVFCSTGGDKVWRSVDDGKSWIPSYNKIGGLDIQGFFKFGDNLWIAVANVGIFSSSDSGNNWVFHDLDSLQSGLAMSGFGSVGNALIADGTTSGPLRSTDSGKSWTRIQKGLWRYFPDTHMVIGMDHPANFLTIDDTILGCTEHGLFRSVDSGLSWIPTDSIMSAHAQPTYFYSIDTCGGYLFAATDEYGVLRSSNNGLSWIECDSGLPSKSVHSLKSLGRAMFCGMNGQGVCLSTNFGESWQGVSSGTNLSHVYHLEIAEGYLLASDDAHGIWRRPLSDFGISSVTQRATTNNSNSVYPNPLTHSTTITFTASDHGVADIRILNLLGVEVTRVFSGEITSGDHSWVWQRPVGLAPGAYECIIRMNGRAECVPLVVE